MAAAPSSPELWMTAQELAEARLPGLPASKSAVNRLVQREGWNLRQDVARRRAGRDGGGGFEYHVSLLPEAARAELARRNQAARLQSWETLPASSQAVAEQRLAAVERVEAWMRAGMPRSRAAQEAAIAAGVEPRSLWRWLAEAAGLTGEARLVALAPKTARASGAAGAAQLEGEARAAADWAAVQAGALAFNAAPEGARLIAEARRAALTAVEALASGGGLSQEAARAAFSEGWLEGERFGLEPDVAARLGVSVSASTLRSWARAFAREALGGLIPKWGAHRKGAGLIDQDARMRETVEGMILANPGGSARLILRLLEARFPAEKIPNRRTLEGWIAKWREAHPDLYRLAVNPDSYKSGVRLVVGSASEDVVRLNQRWEMDSTPNDVLLADGKRAALIGCIDVFSRRAKIVVARTSNAAGVAACLRKAILSWGVPETVKMDNGADYKSVHVRRVCEALQVEQMFCKPFTPEAKPHIERFFGSFTRDLVELLEGFIGHSVAHRQAIEARKSFAARLMDRRAEPLELRMTAEDLQAICDQWCEVVYGESAHGSLKRSPNARAQAWTGSIRRVEDERALDLLLMPAGADGGWRTVRKTGVTHERHAYIDPELQRWIGRRVQIRLDEEDMGRVLILDEEGGFVCWGLNPDLAGVSRPEAAAILRGVTNRIEREGLARIREGKRAVKTAAPEILAAAVRRAEEKDAKVLPFPKAVEAHVTPALEAAAEAAEARPAAARRLIGRPEVTEAQVLALETARPVERRRKETAHDRFLRWEGLDAKLKAGELLGEVEGRFWRAFPQSTEYAALRDLIKDFGREAVLGGGASAPSAG